MSEPFPECTRYGSWSQAESQLKPIHSAMGGWQVSQKVSWELHCKHLAPRKTHARFHLLFLSFVADYRFSFFGKEICWFHCILLVWSLLSLKHLRGSLERLLCNVMKHVALEGSTAQKVVKNVSILLVLETHTIIVGSHYY